MSQFKWGPIDPDTTSGTQLAQILTQGENALHSNHLNGAPPNYAQDGMLWWSTATADQLNMFLRWSGVDYPFARFRTDTLEFEGGTAAWGSITGTLNDQTDLFQALEAKLSIDGSNQMTGMLVGPAAEFAYTAGTAGVRLDVFGLTGYNVTTENVFQISDNVNNEHLTIRSKAFLGIPIMQFSRNDEASNAAYNFITGPDTIGMAAGVITLPQDPSADDHAIRKGWADIAYQGRGDVNLTYAGGYYIQGDSLTAPNGSGAELDPISWAYTMINDGRIAGQINAENGRGVYWNGYGPGGGGGDTWDLSGYAQNPDHKWAIVHMGSNDVDTAGPPGTTPGKPTESQFKTAYQQLLDDLIALDGIEAVYCVLPPFNDVPGWDVTLVRRWILDLRPDAWDWPLGKPTQDGIHMTQAGHNAHAATAHPFLLKVNSDQDYLLVDGSRAMTGTLTTPEVNVAYTPDVGGALINLFGIEAAGLKVTAARATLKQGFTTNEVADQGAFFDAFSGQAVMGHGAAFSLATSDVTTQVFQGGTLAFDVSADGATFRDTLDAPVIQTTGYSSGTSGAQLNAFGLDTLIATIHTQANFNDGAGGAASIRGNNVLTVPTLEFGESDFISLAAFNFYTNGLGQVVSIAGGQIALPVAASSDNHAVRLGELAAQTEHLLYGPQHTDVNNSLGLVPRHGLFWDGNEFLAQTRMNWRNIWTQQTYQVHDVVYDEGWAMVANKVTDDKAAPEPVGEPFNVHDDEPSWTTSQYTGHVYSGMRLTVPDDGMYQVQGGRVWVQDVSPDAHYQVLTRNLQTGDVNLIRAFDGNILNEPGWLDIGRAPIFIFEGEVYDILLHQWNSATDDVTTDEWARTGNSNANADPGVASWNRASNNATVRFNHNSANGNQESLLTDPSLVGSVLRIENRANSAQWVEYTINSIDNQATWVNYGTSLIGTGPSGEPPVGSACDGIFRIPNELPTTYVVLTGGANEWPALQGYFSTDSLGDTPPNANLYAPDTVFQEYTESDDWDLLAAPGGGEGGSGGGPGGPGVEWPLLAPPGALGAPSYSFQDNAEVGWYFESNQLKASVGQTDSPFQVTSLGTVALLSAADTFVANKDGDNTVTAYSFNNSINSGFNWNDVDNEIDVLVEGNKAGAFTTLGFVTAGVVSAGAVAEGGQSLIDKYATLAAFDSHTGDLGIHFEDAPDSSSYARQQGAWVPISGGVEFPLLAPANDTAAAPSYSWAGFANSGFSYDDSNNYIVGSIGGNAVARFTGLGFESLGVLSGGSVNSDTIVQAPRGADGDTPVFRFSNNTNTGISSPAFNQLGFVVQGLLRAQLTATAFNVLATGFNTVVVNATSNITTTGGNIQATGTNNYIRTTGTGSYIDSPELRYGGQNTDDRYELKGGGGGPGGFPLEAPNDSAAAPSYTWASNTNTGLYRPTTNQIGVSIQGTQRAVFSSTGMGVTGGLLVTENITATTGLSATTGQVLAPVGSATTPSFAFNGRTNQGLFSNGISEIGLAVGGSAQMTLSTSQIVVSQDFRIIDGTTSVPGLNFGSDSNTGIRRVSTDHLSIVAGGVDMLEFDENGTTSSNTDIIARYPIRSLGTNVTMGASSPAFSFDNDTDTGMFRQGTNSLGFAAGGSERMRVASSSITAFVSVNFSNQRLTSVGTPTSSTDGVNKSYADAMKPHARAYLEGDATPRVLSGDNVTGISRISSTTGFYNVTIGSSMGSNPQIYATADDGLLGVSAKRTSTTNIEVLVWNAINGTAQGGNFSLLVFV